MKRKKPMLSPVQIEVLRAAANGNLYWLRWSRCFISYGAEHKTVSAATLRVLRKYLNVTSALHEKISLTQKGEEALLSKRRV